VWDNYRQYFGDLRKWEVGSGVWTGGLVGETVQRTIPRFVMQ
jgi:hypothetical protein